jgi:hypothetical protein
VWRKITDFEGQIATCCTASEEGMVCIIQDAVDRVITMGLYWLGVRAANIVGVENLDIDENIAYLAGRNAAGGKKKKRNRRKNNKKCEEHCVISALFEVTMPATAQNCLSSNGMHNNHT